MAYTMANFVADLEKSLPNTVEVKAYKGNEEFISYRFKGGAWTDDKPGSLVFITGAWEVEREEALKDALDRYLKGLILDKENFPIWKKQICPRLMGKGTLIVEGRPYRVIEDMVLTYSIFLGTNAAGEFVHVPVTDKILSAVGVTEAELYETSLKEASVHYPLSILTMTEMLRNRFGLPAESIPKEEIPMFVAACGNGLYGASCILYPEFFKTAERRLGGDFFILPCSIHEVILVPAKSLSGKEQDLKGMVLEANCTVIEPWEKLSDNVYFHKAGTDFFEKIQL